ncbi:MAG: YjgP/YjgQ family permease, partial [Chitinophagaceae bacterium]
DYMLPKANLKYGSLLYDMRNKKLSFLIKPGVFNNSITNYAMRVERKGEGSTDSLFGITIYDHSAGNGIAKIIMAEKGQMAKTKDGQYLVLKLINGVRYEESNGSTSSFNARQVLTRMRFRETEVKFDFSSFKGMDRTQESQFANNAQMLNRAELINRRDSLTRSIDTMNKATKMNVVGYYKQSSFTRGYTKINLPARELNGPLINSIPLKDQAQAVQSASDQAETVKQVIANRVIEHDVKSREVIKAKIEYQRKYTLAISCLLLFFIGAPLGAIIRKGGLGLPVVIAVVFFLIYHIISTVSEKSAKEGTLDPIFGMWMAIIILTPLGIFLTYKATVDSALFDLDYYKQLFVRLFRFKKK